MKTAIARLGLHFLAALDALWLKARERRAARTAAATTAGAGVQSSQAINVLSFGEIAWPEFPTLAHSFWRAQELTLFRTHHGFFAEPVLDLGCGDSLFGQIAGFPKTGFGLDYDPTSLRAAKELGSSLEFIRADAGNAPLADGSVAVCLSNSVLEHLPDLDRCFAETCRLLRPGGLFIFSMTLGSFTSQLSFWTGRRDAAFWVQRFGHVQQPSEEELMALLSKHGFVIQERISYQASWTTALYRLLVSPCFQFGERRLSASFRRRLQSRLADRVIASLRATGAGEGACVFVVARKNLA